MAAVLEELIRAVEQWLRTAREREPVVDPDLDPVLLVPGIAGSILNAVDEQGNQERVWVRILGADHEFEKKLWSFFDPKTGETISIDKKVKIVVPEDRHGLYAIDILDPDMIVGQENVFYFHDMIEQMIKWGYEEGKTLFGFGYDFRQSNRLQETMDRLSAKLQSMYSLSGGKKINIISHSMGGILVKCFLSLHADIFERYVQNWIAIAAPFQGSPGCITSCLLNGMSFIHGWEQKLFISKWSMHQLLIECPSIYELLGNPDFCWENTPVLQVWKEVQESSGCSSVMLESFKFADAISVMNEALASNMVEWDGQKIPLPLNREILKWASETQEVLSRARLPSTVKFYNIYGIDQDTPNSVCYGSETEPVKDLKDLPRLEAEYINVSGDKSVPMESAKADGFDAVARIGVPADHRGIICNRHVFRILKCWLHAGEPDPFYNPINDYVILPTAFEIETHSEEAFKGAAHKGDWEIISPDDTAEQDRSPTSSMGGEEERINSHDVVLKPKATISVPTAG